MSVSTAPEDQSDLNFGVIVTLFNETSNLLDSPESDELEEEDEIEVSDQLSSIQANRMLVKIIQ